MVGIPRVCRVYNGGIPRVCRVYNGGYTRVGREGGVHWWVYQGG